MLRPLCILGIHTYWSDSEFFLLYAADARQRIVSERIDLNNNLVISVSVSDFKDYLTF
jgi:hypothetical protein